MYWINPENEKVFVYTSDEEINEDYYKLKVEKYLKSGYNEYEAQMLALEELQLQFNIYFKEVVDDGIRK